MATNDVATLEAGRAATRPDDHAVVVTPAVGFAYHAIAWGVAAFQVVRIAASDRYGRADAFVDDAYYYFETARNIAVGRGSTFNGLVSTNGYHPLWLLLLVPVFFVVRGRYPGIVAGKVAAAAVWVVAVLQVRRLARAVGHERTFWIGLLPGAVFCAVEVRSLPFAGVEAGLVLLWLVVIARLLVESGLLAATGAREARPGARTWMLGAALLLLVLSRLDSVFTVAVLLGVIGVRLLIARRSPREIVGLAVPLAGPLVVGMSLYMAVNWWLFGLIQPVSGLAKQTAAPVSGWPAMRTYFTQSIGFGIPIGPAPAAAAVLLAAVAALWWSRRAGRRAAALEILTAVLALAFVSSIVKMAYYDLTTSWMMFPWYFYESMFVLLLAPGVIAAVVAEEVVRRRALPGPGPRGGPTRGPAASTPRYSGRRTGAVLLACTVAVAALGGYAARIESSGDETWFAQEARGADVLNRVLPAGAVVAMGDRAGLFGYLVRRPVITLEGIMGDKEMLDAIRARKLHAYAAAHGVDFYARSDFLGPKVVAADRTRGETGPALSCRPYREPSRARGAHAFFRVCTGDLIYRATTPGGHRLAVWRYPGLTRQPGA